jgi:hypothetical protein
MSEDNQEVKTKGRYPDRFTVYPENLEKIGKLLEQLRSGTPGCRATRKDVLNWIVGKVPDSLSPADMKELSDLFYDEESFVKIALAEIRAAKSRGERLTLEEILGRKGSVAAAPKHVRKRRATTNETTDPTANPE